MVVWASLRERGEEGGGGGYLFGGRHVYGFTTDVLGLLSVGEVFHSVDSNEPVFGSVSLLQVSQADIFVANLSVSSSIVTGR